MIQVFEGNWIETLMIEAVRREKDAWIITMSSGKEVKLSKEQFIMFKGVILKPSNMAQEVFAG